MIKNILILIILLTVYIQSAFAAPVFSEPILKKAYEQLNIRIDQKVANLHLSETTKKTIEQKKETLGLILVAIDIAYQKKSAVEFKKQIYLFRNGYKEIINYIQNSNTTPLVENQKTSIINDNKDREITYYSDIFEGKNTANGDIFSQTRFSAATCNIPFNTLLQVYGNGIPVIVKVNDRPNCSKHPDLVDLSKTAFTTIGKITTGRIQGGNTSLGNISKNYTKSFIQTDIFKELGIEIDSGIPNTYLKNETFRITGKELIGKDYTVLYFKSPSGKDITLGKKKEGDDSFEYSYPLEEIGTYQAIISSGLGFSTGIFINIYVLDDTLFSAKKIFNTEQSGTRITKLNIERLELPDFTALYLFHLPSGFFHTLTIKQNEKTYIYKGFQTIALRGDALKELDITRPVSVKITSEKSSTPFSHDTYSTPFVVFEKMMTLSTGYKEERKENIVTMMEGGNLIIRGVIAEGKNVKSDIFITLPDGNVTKYSFDPSNIDSDGLMKRGVVFEKTLPINESGVYLVEVNYDNGFAAYNGPVVIGETLPIYPSNFDNTEKKILTTDINIVKIESLNFINNIRKKSGKSALVLDETLNSLANIKANDMAKFANLSHTDSFGDKISGTAKRNNINIIGGIGENIAGGNINFKILLIGLANSGGHRANMLDSWDKMGVGYAIKDGQIYYVQVFGE